jgi:hypothetical protein
VAITLVASVINAKNQYITTNNQCYDGLKVDVKDEKQQWWSPEPPISSKTMWQVVWPNPAFPRLVWVNTPASILALAIIRTF